MLPDAPYPKQATTPAASGVVCLIAGPTGVGKTAVGVELARRWNSEIVSADSMQVYRHVSAGTAKPAPEETRGIPYHLIDCLDLPERFSAAEFVKRATPILDRLLASGRTPIVTGGTGLYLEALVEGLFEQPAIPPSVRLRIEREIGQLSPKAAHDRLAAVDPAAAARIHPNDRIRIVRALEVYEATGKTIGELREKGKRKARPYQPVLFVLTMPRGRLYERIDRRVERMFAEGLIEETQELLARGYAMDLSCVRALGYSHVADFLARRESGEATEALLRQTIEAVKQSHRNYAKRQLTWFRKMKGAHWIETEGLSVPELADALEKDLALLTAHAG